MNEDLTLESEGVLPVLVRKILLEIDAERTIEFRAKRLKDVRSFSKSKKIQASQYGYAAKLQLILGLKEGREAEAVVAVVDRDSEKYHGRIDDLNEGRAFLQKKGKPCAVGMAIEEIEAWLLADEKALRSALGDDSIQRQPDPEGLSSRDEQSDQNPKRRLARLMEQALGSAVSRSEVPDYFSRIAQDSDIQQLETRCPEGFCPFAAQVRELPNL
jgi:hypothetical protein